MRDLDPGLDTLIEAAEFLATRLGKDGDGQARRASSRLRDSVLRPLRQVTHFRSVLGSYIDWGSRLAVENSQTGAQPPEHMPMPQWHWQTAAGPPGSRISALAPTDQDDEQSVALPEVGQAVRYADHIKPLFRRRDRQSMQFAFDLWSHGASVSTPMPFGSAARRLDALRRRLARREDRGVPAMDQRRQASLTGVRA